MLKKLYVQQMFNPHYQGPDSNHADRHTYRVIKLVNATAPALNDELSTGALQIYCEDDDWLVTVT